MNQLTKVLLSSMLLKHIKRVSTLRHNNNQHFKSQRLTQTNRYFDSDMKPIRGGFKTSENIPFQDYIKQSINKFPYCKLPKYNQRFS